MVVVPIANDQPGIAARVKARGAGVVVPMRKLNPARLRKAAQLVLQDPGYREAARNLQKAFREIDGPGLAADLIEQALQIRSAQQIA